MAVVPDSQGHPVNQEPRTFSQNDAELQALRDSVPTAVFRTSVHVLGRWQDAGLSIRPTTNGFALQAPLGARMQSIGWMYAPDPRHSEPRVEVAIRILQRRGVPQSDLDALRDDLEAFTDGGDAMGLITIPITSTMSIEDTERLAATLVQFAHSLA